MPSDDSGFFFLPDVPIKHKIEHGHFYGTKVLMKRPVYAIPIEEAIVYLIGHNLVKAPVLRRCIGLAPTAVGRNRKAIPESGDEPEVRGYLLLILKLFGIVLKAQDLFKFTV